jgi:TAG lipase/steryl ester hydrolase/phospholipase A2/LPA acyltransferase
LLILTNFITYVGLYAVCTGGTKNIIEDYYRTIIDALHFISDAKDTLDIIPTDAKLAFFNEVRHSFGRTALLLSGE